MFFIEATTPIKSAVVTKSSGKTTTPVVSGKKAYVKMDIPDVYDFYIYMEVTDECETWTPSMKTLPRQRLM